MLCRLALLTLLGAVSACDAPSPGKVPRVQFSTQEEPAVVLSRQQIFERAERCATVSRDEFRRTWNEGTVNAADGKMTADFANHYNARLDTCFYLVTVNRQESGNGQDGAVSITLSRKLLDINENELYGEYLGPAIVESPPKHQPAECRVVGMYCASEREWEVLVGYFMED